MPRTNISISDETAERLSQEAIRRNKTLYAFANESLEAVISICRLAGEPSQVFSSWKMGRILKEIDAVPLPGYLVEKLVKRLYESDKDWLLKAWAIEGDRIGKYLQMSYADISELSRAVMEFQDLLPMKRIEVKEAGPPGSKREMVIRAIGAGLSAESTACAESFMRGLLGSYEWSVKASRISEGIIELETTRNRQ